MIKFLLAYSFRKIFSIGQNLKHIHMTHSFFELLIFFWLTLVTKYLLFEVYFSLHQRNTVYKYSLQRKTIIKEIQIDLHFHLPLILILKSLFFPYRVKIPYQQFLIIFFSFMKTFLKVIKQPFSRSVNFIAS